MTRKSFLCGAGAAVVAVATDPLYGDEPQPETESMKAQREIDEVTGADYRAYMDGNGKDCAAFRRLDAAFEKVFADVQSTVVTDKPAIWFVYNMGLIVKTPQTLFSIDLVHRYAERIAPLLDFALITHNHGDHFTEAFYAKMNGAGKTVISNFKDNYGVKDWTTNGGYTRAKKVFTLKDVEIRTSLTDHNGYLVDFTTTFEIRIGDFVIYHTGDCSNLVKLRPTRTPDLWIVHPRCGLSVAKGVAQLHPKMTVIAHLNELGHDKWRWSYRDGADEQAEAEAAGGAAIVPLWGERIA